MHQLWHITVLVVTLMAGAAVLVVTLAPLVFQSPPPGLRRARPAVAFLVAGAALLLVVEWLIVH